MEHRISQSTHTYTSLAFIAICRKVRGEGCPFYSHIGTPYVWRSCAGGAYERTGEEH